MRRFHDSKWWQMPTFWGAEDVRKGGVHLKRSCFPSGHCSCRDALVWIWHYPDLTPDPTLRLLSGVKLTWSPIETLSSPKVLKPLRTARWLSQAEAYESVS